jgi:catechol 2,3-dioxygenase-like lactoylglutathione lyase family enzyme
VATARDKADTYNEASEQLVLELFVSDVERSLEFYLGLGFTQVAEVDNGFVVVGWDNRLMFLQQEGTEPSQRPPGNVRVMVDDVDRYWALAQRLGVPVARSITDQPYGLRDFTVLDPDGFGVRFATPISGAD